MISAYFSNLSLYRISHLHSLIYRNRNELKRHSKVAELCKLTNDMSVPIMYHPTIVQHTDCPFVPSLCTHTHLPTHIYKWGLLPLLVSMVEFTVALHLSNTAQIASYTKGEWNPPPPPPHKHAAHAYTLCQMQLYKGLALCCYHTCTSIPQSHSRYSHHSPTTEYIGIPGNLKGFTAAVGELIRHEGSRALNYLLVLHCPVQWGLTAPTPSSIPSSITREITCLAHCLWHYFAH